VAVRDSFPDIVGKNSRSREIGTVDLAKQPPRARKNQFRQSVQPDLPCPALLEKINIFRFSGIRDCIRASASSRGRTRDRHDTRGGMRWTLMMPPDERHRCGREIVWSWHPGADAKFAMVL
jgi:hypothetical protein